MEFQDIQAELRAIRLELSENIRELRTQLSRDAADVIRRAAEAEAAAHGALDAVATLSRRIDDVERSSRAEYSDAVTLLRSAHVTADRLDRGLQSLEQRTTIDREPMRRAEQALSALGEMREALSRLDLRIQQTQEMVAEPSRPAERLDLTILPPTSSSLPARRR